MNPFTYRYGASISGAYDQRIGTTEWFNVKPGVTLLKITRITLNSHVYCNQFNGVPINFNANCDIDLMAIGRPEYDSVVYIAGNNNMKGATRLMFGEGQTVFDNVVIRVDDNIATGAINLYWNVMPAFGMDSSMIFHYHINSPVHHDCDYELLIEGFYAM